MKWVQKYINHITGVSGFLLLTATASYLAGFATIQEVALILATFIAGVPIAIKAIQALRVKAFSIELLVTIAVIGALIIGEYVESAAVTFLFLFGAYLEARTLEKTRASLKELIDMAPQEAVILQKDQEVTIPVEAVQPGDKVIIRSGEKVPVDGSVINGRASINEAAITGESVPVTKHKDGHVFGGTIVDHGYLEVVAEKVGDDTTFAKIIELVEEAQETKSKTEKFLDRFAAFYTPAVVLLAVLVYLLTQNFHLSITFLVVACPGALVIGAPVSNVAGIGNGAKHGVLVKGGDVMDRLAKIDTMIFDKTGTLTKGKPEITGIKTFHEEGEDELLRLAARAETLSEHHLGRTIVMEANNRGMAITAGVTGDVIKGAGLIATVEGRHLLIGNAKLMAKEKISVPSEIEAYAREREKQGNTAIFTAIDGKISGVISIADRIREEAAKAIAAMRHNGVRQVIMLTGDNPHTAKLVAERLGLDEFHAELLPEEKTAFVQELQAAGHKVAMAGDGINDAPAIASADIGLAMGAGGTDIAMETADVVLMADKLNQLAHAHALAKATTRNMKQNTTFAVLTVLILLTGVLLGSIHLASGMFIHEASVLIVILNATRLMRFGRPAKERDGIPQPAI
ncbi:heavy metal translocating P-type ATPase [Thalassobacillus devorans]|uniref:heavy metal translocating P-type ATPase n=1 Tax=Thalassobacillus devorans TaxID=279813 RepID=UPI0034E93273